MVEARTRSSTVRRQRSSTARTACIVVSPDELNEHLRTVIVAPMTTAGRAYPWRIRCQFQRRSGYVVLDQVRTVDRERLVKCLGVLSAATMAQVLDGFREMFAE
jgi:mRNA interferase MazF